MLHDQTLLGKETLQIDAIIEKSEFIAWDLEAYILLDRIWFLKMWLTIIGINGVKAN